MKEYRGSYNPSTLCGIKLRELRKEKGDKQSVVAENIGVTPSYISLVESGKKPPSLKMLRYYDNRYGLPKECLGGQDTYLNYRAIAATFASSVESYGSALPDIPTLEEAPNKKTSDLYGQLNGLDEILECHRLLIEQSNSERLFFLWASRSLLFTITSYRDQFGKILDMFFNRGNSSSKTIAHVVRLPEANHPDINIPIFATALQWALRYRPSSVVAQQPAYQFFTIEDSHTIEYLPEIFLTDKEEGIITFPTSQPNRCDAGMSFGKNTAAMKYMLNIRHTAKPALLTYGVGRPCAKMFYEETARRTKGTYRMIHSFFSPITRPIHDFYQGSYWYQMASKEYENDVHHMALLRRERFHRTIENLSQKGGGFKQICPLQGIENWVRNIKVPGNDNIGGLETDADAKINRLDHIIYLLENYPSFEIAIPKSFELPKLSWATQGTERVILSKKLPTSSPHRNDLSDNYVRTIIDHEDVGAAFIDYFENLWSDINKDEKDRRYIIRTLSTLQEELYKK